MSHVSSEKWLAQLGFWKNPFAETDANRERKLVPNLFVACDGYDSILGNETVCVAGPRGSGKTAIQIQLASQLAPIRPDSCILAVECTEPPSQLGQLLHNSSSAIAYHVHWLLYWGVKALLDAVADGPNAAPRKGDGETRQHHRSRPAEQLHSSQHLAFAQLIRKYHPELLQPLELWERLQRMGVSLPTDQPLSDMEIRNTFSVDVHEQKLRIFMGNRLDDDPGVRLLVNLVDARVSATTTAAGSHDDLRRLQQLAEAAGYETIHFLVNDLDIEPCTHGTGTDLDVFLTVFKRLQVDGVVYKIFLTAESCEEASRLHRLLPDNRVVISWREPGLKHLLDTRLGAYSCGKCHNLAQLSETQTVGEGIEREMIIQAHGSPRRLLNAGQCLVQAHVDQGQTDLLSWEDWLSAKQALDTRA